MCPNILKKHAFEIVKTLRNAGFKAFIVGGAPRDMAMGLDPKDYDIATDASTDDVSRLFERTYPVGRKFGVSIVMFDDSSFEVSQFRTEGEYVDGRRPSVVKPADETEDVKRRDFTINALLYDPEKDQLIDLVSGFDDIKAGRIKAIGNPAKRFAEDHLRMLRAVRFSARFNFKIEKDTFEAIKQNAGEIKTISPERIGEELSKMFTANNPAKALTLLDKTGLLEVVLPEVSSLKGVEQPKKYHPEGNVFEHTRIMLEMFNGGSVTLAFGILLHDIAKPITATKTDRIRFSLHDSKGKEIAGKIMRRLRFGNEIVSRVQSLVGNHMRFVNVPHMKQSTLRRFIALEGFHELLELFRLDCLASHGNLDIYEFLKKEINHKRKENKSLDLPEPLVGGKDLISLGYGPGKIFNTILKAIQDAQLEGELSSKKEAFEFIRKHFPLNSHKRKRGNNLRD
ncbi:CCA tRNA nucleotidyltransferase [Candidatus Latescibacterota bacterium]